MKKLFSILLAFVVFFSCMAFPMYAIDTGKIIEESKGTCTNHNFSRFSGYSAAHNQHTYRCSNPGCTAYMVEECYFSEFCGEYLNDETKPCSRCGYGTIYIHNYEPFHHWYDDDYYHILQCTNTADEATHGYYDECQKTTGDYVECSLGDRQIWRGFKANRGHYLTQTCCECGYEYDVGYYYPPNHPNYFSVSNDCQFCQMSSPYHMDW